MKISHFGRGGRIFRGWLLAIGGAGGAAVVQVAFALPPTTSWLPGNGDFFSQSRWSDGIPGYYYPEQNHQHSMTEFTGPYYSWSDMTVDNGTANASLSVRTVYNVTGAPKDRYSIPDLVKMLYLPRTVVGKYGTGTLASTGGMYFYISDLLAGENAGSSGTVSVTGQKFGTNPSSLFLSGAIIGKSGTGNVVVSGGADASYNDIQYFMKEADGSIRIQNRWDLRMAQETGSAGNITVQGPGSRFTATEARSGSTNWAVGMMIGRKGTANMLVTSGGSVQARAGRLGTLPGGNGIVTVTGGDSRWDVDSQLWIGEKGSGTLNVTAGGLVRSAFGDFGDGTLINTEQSKDGYAFDFGSIGSAAGSSGNVLVTGAGSRWEHNANLVVGSYGNGNVTIENGGVIVSATRGSSPNGFYFDPVSATLGEIAGVTGTVTVRGTGSRWQNGSPLSIGERGIGKLTVGSGGTVDVGGAGPVILASKTGSTGELVIGGSTTAGPGTIGGTAVAGGEGNATVTFQHNSTGFTFGHSLTNIDRVQNTGPGKTTLSGRLTNVAVIAASAGTLELTNNQSNLTSSGIMVTGGTLALKGSSLVLPPNLFGNGLFSRGNINISNGGNLSALMIIAGSSGFSSTLTVDGAGSTYTPQASAQFVLPVGTNGAGTVALKNGGRLAITPQNGAQVVLGAGSAGYGTLDISGSGTSASIASLVVGREGLGRVLLSNSGALTTNGVLLGSLAGGSGFVEIASGASWQINENTFKVGIAASGSVILQTGGQMRIGSTGTGQMILGDTESGSGYLQIGNGGLAGNLLAGTVTTGDSEDIGRVLFKHSSTNHVFSPRLSYVALRMVDGHTGFSTLTAPNSSVTDVIVTTGGLGVSQGGKVAIGSELVVGDERTQDMNGGTRALVQLDGGTMSADRLAYIGVKADAELRLKNGGLLEVGRPEQWHEVILGDLGGVGTVIFGGAGAAPGKLSASAIRSVTSGSKVVFDHSGSNFSGSFAMQGNLAVDHTGSGRTLLTGAMPYTGATRVTAGSFLFTNNLSSIITATGGLIGGTGTIPRINLNSGSTLSPGLDSTGLFIGTQRVRVLNVYGGSKIRIDLGPNLTCDRILNNDASVTTPFFQNTSGNVTFDFRNQGINRNGVYPVLITNIPFSTSFMSRLLYTSNFPLQGSFRQTRVGATTQLEFVVTSFTNSPYATWASTYALSADGNGAPDADPDHDGLPNSIEYVLRSSPVSGVPQNMPTHSVTEDALHFAYLQRGGEITEFRVEIEYSSDMKTWTLPTAAMLEVFTISGQGTFHTATIPRPSNGRPLFARLKVSPVTP